MRIEYAITLGKDGPKITHRVITGGEDDGGVPVPTGVDPGGVPVPTGVDPGGVPVPTGVDPGGVPVPTGVDPGSGPAMGGDCGTIIVLGPTIITGGGGLRGAAGTKSLRPLPATFEIDEVPDRTADRLSEAVSDKITEHTISTAEMRGQEQWYWCWAAVGSAVRQFMDSTSAMRQCDVADMVMADENRGVTSLLSSCQDPRASNGPRSLSTTLTLLKNLQNGALGRLASFELIKRETGAGRPIAARIAWDTYGRGVEEGAHFVLIAGWETLKGVDMVKILDPAAGLTDPQQAAQPRAIPIIKPRSIPYREFRDAYNGIGKWVASYFVKEMSK